MSGRRKHARFVVSSNDGVLQVARDVSVIWTDGEPVAISSAPATVGDSLRIETIVDGVIAQFAVRVEESRPIVVAGAIRHRIRMTRVDPNGRTSNGRAPETTNAMEEGPTVPERSLQGQPARLSRDNHVRVLNCSDAACLLETAHPVAVNTVAGLQVWFDGHVFDDVVRVIRCELMVESDNLYRVAVELLAVTPAYAGSLRCLVRQEISYLEGGFDDLGYE